MNGVISEYKLKDDNVTIKLEGDENNYWINNIVYDKLKPSFGADIKTGESASLLIGYTDKNDRKVISQLEMKGTIYLDKDVAEKAEYDNYIDSIIFSYVLLSLGGALIVAWIPCLICSAKIKVYEE